jgi:Flp pilus assembly protein TadB
MRKSKSILTYAVMVTLLLSACSQAKYGSRTRKVKGTQIVKTKSTKEKNEATDIAAALQQHAEDDSIETTPLAVDPIPAELKTVAPVTVKPIKILQAESISQDNITTPTDNTLDKVVNTLETRVNKRNRFKKLSKKMAQVKTNKNGTADYDASGLLRDILIILLIVILVSLILSLLPNPLSYLLSVILTILLILYLLKILL